MHDKVVKIRRGRIKDAQRISELAQTVALQFIVEKGVYSQPITCPVKRPGAATAK